MNDGKKWWNIDEYTTTLIPSVFPMNPMLWDKIWERETYFINADVKERIRCSNPCLGWYWTWTLLGTTSRRCIIFRLLVITAIANITNTCTTNTCYGCEQFRSLCVPCRDPDVYRNLTCLVISWPRSLREFFIFMRNLLNHPKLLLSLKTLLLHGAIVSATCLAMPLQHKFLKNYTCNRGWLNAQSRTQFYFSQRNSANYKATFSNITITTSIITLIIKASFTIIIIISITSSTQYNELYLKRVTY